MNGRWTFDAGESAGEDAVAREVLRDKLDDALTPGYQVAFAPGEAERAGAFMEHALSEQDAADSDIDLVDARDRPAGDGKE